MWREPMKFIQEYVSCLDENLRAESDKRGLSIAQRGWISFCLMGILLTNSVCWAKFERASFGAYSQQALSWMFRHAKLPWNSLLRTSVRMIIKRLGITEGFLIVDDKDISRSKNAKKLHRLHKLKDKNTGGYCLGQNIVCLYFVTPKASIPVGFEFYAPDPAQKEWRDRVKKLKKQGVKKAQLPAKPGESAKYPKKYALAIKLLDAFKRAHFGVTVKAVLADGLYGHLPFIEGIEQLWPGIQIISKMRKNQKLRYGNKVSGCGKHFASYGGWQQEITIRGRSTRRILAGGGRLYVPSHGTKRFVIAMKYEGENNYRYLMATNLSWNMKEVMEAFSIRWLIEVFFEDWSGHHGFCSLAKQCGEEGSLRPLILSLLFDHCFFFHEDQCSSLKHNRPLATFGSLAEKSQVQALCHFVQQLLEDESPKKRLQELVDSLDDLYPLRASKKHMIDVECVVGAFSKAA